MRTQLGHVRRMTGVHTDREPPMPLSLVCAHICRSRSLATKWMTKFWTRLRICWTSITMIGWRARRPKWGHEGAPAGVFLCIHLCPCAWGRVALQCMGTRVSAGHDANDGIGAGWAAASPADEPLIQRWGATLWFGGPHCPRVSPIGIERWADEPPRLVPFQAHHTEHTTLPYPTPSLP